MKRLLLAGAMALGVAACHGGVDRQYEGETYQVTPKSCLPYRVHAHVEDQEGRGLSVYVHKESVHVFERGVEEGFFAYDNDGDKQIDSFSSDEGRFEKEFPLEGPTWVQKQAKSAWESSAIGYSGDIGELAATAQGKWDKYRELTRGLCKSKKGLSVNDI
jgi:hypothetical protein